MWVRSCCGKKFQNSRGGTSLLKFSSSNSKLAKLEKVTNKKVYSFSLLSGKTCPGAKDCLAWVTHKNGKRKIIDGKHQKFRCFSASQEALYTNVYASRKHNTDTLKACKSKDEIVKLIEKSFPKQAEIVRVHVAGDYFSQDYLDAWLEVAKAHPKVLFYSYTKSLPFLTKRLNQIPKNFSFTTSRGGRYDNMIEKYHLKFAEVVFSRAEARNKNLKIDETDKRALLSKDSFSLLLHGIQRGNSSASKALQKLKRFSYVPSKKS